MSVLARLKRWVRSGDEAAAARDGSNAGTATLDQAKVEAGLIDATASLERGAMQEAIRRASAVLDIDPTCAAAHLHLGRAQRALDALDDAADSLQLAIHYAPAMVDAYVELAALYKRAGRLDEAIGCYCQGVAQVPGAVILHSNLALALLDAGRPDEALAACDVAIGLDAGLAQAWHNRGYIRLQIGEPERALADFDRALALQPSSMATLSCRAHALRDLARFDDARACYRAVLDRTPDFADAQINLAFTDLLLGDFSAGWPRYEWRFGKPGEPLRGFPYPLWRGEPLEAKGLLVHAEQAIGDEIMFASCVPDVLARAGHCVIECNTRLAPLFARSFPQAHVHGAQKTEAADWLGQAPRCDYQSAIGSLPVYLRRSPSDFAQRAAYLIADPQRVAHWRRVFAADGRLAVGICWRGGTLRSRQFARSVSAEQFAPILSAADCRYVNLQFRARDEELASLRELAGVEVLTVQGIGEDIDELAAQVSALDLVISVGCTVAHVAGALGKEVWVLLAAVPEWRYGYAGTTMPWYPSARLFRQSSRGSWSGVLDAVGESLAARAHAAHRLGGRPDGAA